MKLIDTLIENREQVKPHQANPHGVVHGGVVMSLMDEAAAMSAMRFTGKPCVTVKVDELTFEKPIPVGKIAFIRSFVYKYGRTSVDIHLQVFCEDPRTMETHLTSQSNFRFVAVNDDGDPTPHGKEINIKTEKGEELEGVAKEYY